MPSDESPAPAPVSPIELLGRVPYGRLATSMRALPFLAVARHIVSDGRILLRMHSGFGYHEACDGSVVAYGADNYNAASADEGDDLWSVQFTGPAEIVHPCPSRQNSSEPPPSAPTGNPSLRPISGSIRTSSQSTLWTSAQVSLSAT
ncbi:Pyridoxamine 5'-phosphate oxidase family protein OS=Streptomyces microflavus OX=1919 GN=G3I39_34040 PE=4 SV=1 [Streptomyces microflavus]